MEHKDSSYSAWLEEQQRRTEHLHNACREKDTPHSQDLSNVTNRLGTKIKSKIIRVSDQHKVVYCSPAKAGCTTWKLLFLQLAGNLLNVDIKKDQSRIHSKNLLMTQGGLVPLDSYSLPDSLLRLETYSKFIIVRHPYIRLHSAFTDKFRVPDGKPVHQPSKKVSKLIKERYWNNPTAKDLNTPFNVSFEDFIHYLSDKDLPLSQRFANDHWRPYHWDCFPCQIPYDYILKVETLDEDSEQILAHVLNTSHRMVKMNSMQKSTLSVYDGIPKEYMDSLWEVFAPDFELFGYTWPGYNYKYK